MLKPENVWDYPRPPLLEPVAESVRVSFHGTELICTKNAFRVLETSHPPVYYLPPTEFIDGSLQSTEGSSYCEWKGRATYHDVVVGQLVLPRVGWSYPSPTDRFKAIAGYVALYANELECFVDDERVKPQPGQFYGGWVTSNLTGPFKGVPGSSGW